MVHSAPRRTWRTSQLCFEAWEYPKGFSQRTAYQTGIGKQRKSTNSSLNCKPAAMHSNSGLLPPSWKNPNAISSPRSFSSTQKGASSWDSLLLSSKPADAHKDSSTLQKETLQEEQGAAVILQTPPSHPPSLLPTFSCARDTISCTGLWY